MRLFGSRLCRGKHREQDRRENGDNRDDDEQFDEREARGLKCFSIRDDGSSSGWEKLRIALSTVEATVESEIQLKRKPKGEGLPFRVGQCSLAIA